MIAADAIACRDIKRKHSGGSYLLRGRCPLLERTAGRRRPLRHGVSTVWPHSGGGTSSLVWRLGCKDTGRYGVQFLDRLLLHYGIYRRYPLRPWPAFKNAWRISFR